jgi:hypothetical protein
LPNGGAISGSDLLVEDVPATENGLARKGVHRASLSAVRG